MRRSAGVAFVRLEDCTVLLAKRSSRVGAWSGTWAQPGGGVDPGEEAHEAAFREVEEELGVRPSWIAKHGQVLGCLEVGRSRPFSLFVVAVPITPRMTLRLNEENTEAQWVPLDAPEEVERWLGEGEKLHPGTRASWAEVRRLCHSVRA